MAHRLVGKVGFLMGWLAILASATSATAVQHHYFTVTVVDKVTGLPIPGIRMTTNGVVFLSGTDGKILYYEPGAMGLNVFLTLGSCSIPQGQTQGTCVNGSGTATTCTSHADCNLGYAPPLTFFGTTPGVVLNAPEQGRARVQMCPPGGTCTPGTVVDTAAAAPTPNPNQMFKITVVDPATGRGVPLITVSTSTQTYITDSGGVVAFYDAARMGTTVHFDLAGHGYAATASDLVAAAGGSASISMIRVNLAERLYRITGAGIYRDTVLMEQSAPLTYPVLDAQVTGSDSVLSAVYQGKAFWIWGDTGRQGAVLGTFRAPGATSLLPAGGGLDPSVGVNLDYFPDGTGFVAPMCPDAGIPAPSGYSPGSLRCWMGNLVAVPDAGGTERLIAVYSLGQGFTSLKNGWAQFNDTLKYFQQLTVLDGTEKLGLGGAYMVRHGATTYAYGTSLGSTLALIPTPPYYVAYQIDDPVRTLATVAGVTTPASYEAYTPFQQGSDTTLDYNADGSLHYAWRVNTKPLEYNSSLDPSVPADQKLYGHVTEPNTGDVTYVSGGNVAWNAYRGRYVLISGQLLSGEQFYLEADTPLGPWAYTRKVVHHDNYTNYGTRHHAFFDKQNGREIFFEATYTAWLSSSPPTPRYNYNQIMYKLDLANAGVVLPVPVYDLSQATVPGNFVTKRGLRPTTPDSTAVFQAPDRPGMAGTLPVWWTNAACMPRQLALGGSQTTDPVFWALPPDSPNPPTTTVPLYEYVNASTGARAYSIDPALSLSGFTRNTNPLALVWRNTMRVTLPVHDYLASLIADAGTDQCAQEHAPGIGASVTLSAAQTVLPSGVTATYNWTWAAGAATGTSPTVTLPAGMNLVILTVTGSDGQSNADTVVVNVASCPSGCC